MRGLHLRGGRVKGGDPPHPTRYAMRRDDGENELLRALVEGADLAGLGTSAHSEPDANAKRVAHLQTLSAS
jgi:hypothetical protein